MKSRTKTCSDCLQALPLKKFSKGDSKYNRRSACKACRADGLTKKQREIKLKSFPALYVKCEVENCGYIYKKKMDPCPRCRRVMSEQIAKLPEIKETNALYKKFKKVLKEIENDYRN